MSDSPTAAVAVFWSMLVGGAGLSVGGLAYSLTRYAHWKAAGEEDGDLILGDRRLAVGQRITLAPGDRHQPADPSGTLCGEISSFHRNDCVLRLESDLFARSAAHRGASATGNADPVGLPLSIGQRVTVSVTAATELYRFAARLRDIHRSEGAVLLYISRPKVISRIQRRRHARVPLNLPATFERLPAPSLHAGAKPLLNDTEAEVQHGTLTDLSGGGLRAQIGGILRVHELDLLLATFRPDTTVRVSLPFPELPHRSLVARVRTARRAVAIGGLTLQVACEFLPMPDWEQDLVVRRVFQRQREHAKGRGAKPDDDQSGLRK